MKPSLDQKWLITESMPQKKTRKTFWEKKTESEAENLVASLRETDSMVQTVLFFFCKEQYIDVNFLPQMIHDLFR